MIFKDFTNNLFIFTKEYINKNQSITNFKYDDIEISIDE